MTNTSERKPPPQAPADAHRYLAGDVIDRKYRLTRIIGEGGMGAVWLARNTSLDVDVAVKLIHRELARPETSQRLLQEARAAARLKHPSIVRVFDFGESEHGDPFIVMEVLTGESLRDVLDRKARLPATAAVRTLLPVASALAAAHGQGIVHRDLKPDNVVLVTDETGAVIPKVVDFGIAKLRKEEIDGKITVAGTVMGSPDYMSPEQARGRDETDERTDVWALSVVLYEAVTGKPPFAGPNYNALLTAIMLDEPTPITEHAAGDSELWSILERGLAKTREQRWSTMREMGGALAEWCLGQGHDTDVAGTSLVAHWIANSERRPLSEMPHSMRRVATPETLAPPAGVLDAISAEAPRLITAVIDVDESPGTVTKPTAEPVQPRVVRTVPVVPVAAPRRSGALARIGWILAIVASAAAAWFAFRDNLTGDVAPQPHAATPPPTAVATTTAPPAAPPAATAAPPAAVSSARPTFVPASASVAPPAAPPSAAAPVAPVPRGRPGSRTPVKTDKPTSAPAGPAPAKPKGLQIPDAPNF